ncbi:tRNA lysidine(34) synthetase TilS [Candidatus Saccharibacteria bacterium]|nr:tRNA lysidine(34) synthetase TilS [Candidatus Saccharibacteria bacterium]
MKKILAVSGGIDSMVLMHIYRNDPGAVVAHFDHGIRPCSNLDLEFVQRVAKSYGRPFFAMRAELGENSSEEKARNARYAFLRQLSREQKAKIFVAHHADDVAETMAINILRGTGWRGIAPFGNDEIVRPLLKWNKAQIYKYASRFQIRFRADSTNTEDKYLRNRIRRQFLEYPEISARLKNEFLENYQLRAQIEQLDSELVNDSASAPRDFYRQLDDACALELLRYRFQLWQVSLTRPQLARALFAIRTYQPNKSFSLNRRYLLRLGRHNFSLEEQG